MATTVEEAFRVFHGRLTPTGGESQAAKRHRASIEARLKRRFGIRRFFRTGSFGNGTSIRGHSDVDYFASIPRENLRQDSNTTLRIVRNALDARFPDTGVAVRAPAVLVPFGTSASESTEVVPADLAGSVRNFLVYRIPDGSGGWMESSPEAHNAYVAYIDSKLGRKVKPLVRFLKAWRYYRRVPISSFYLELRTAQYASGEKSIVYAMDVQRILRRLWDGGLASMQDPMSVSGYVRPCRTSAQKVDAMSKLGRALMRAEKAREAERAGRIRTAFYWWGLVFNGRFPAYG